MARSRELTPCCRVAVSPCRCVAGAHTCMHIQGLGYAKSEQLQSALRKRRGKALFRDQLQSALRKRRGKALFRDLGG